MNLEKEIIIIMIFVAVVCTVGIIFIKDNQIHYIQGLAVGTLVSSLKLKLLNRRIAREIVLEQSKVFAYSMMGYTLRYLFTAFIMTISAVYSIQMFIGTTIGLLTLRVALLLKTMRTEVGYERKTNK